MLVEISWVEAESEAHLSGEDAALACAEGFYRGACGPVNRVERLAELFNPRIGKKSLLRFAGGGLMHVLRQRQSAISWFLLHGFCEKLRAHSLEAVVVDAPNLHRKKPPDTGVVPQILFGIGGSYEDAPAGLAFDATAIGRPGAIIGSCYSSLDLFHFTLAQADQF